MKDKIINFLRISSPFWSTLILWRLSANFWNPGGILALISIFYFSFIKKVPYFSLYAVIFCFLIDYKFETLVFWTVLYCLFYAINGFQTYVDLTKIDNNAIIIFMGFLGLGLLILLIPNISWFNIGNGLWLFIWPTLLYLPITKLLNRVYNDR